MNLYCFLTTDSIRCVDGKPFSEVTPVTFTQPTLVKQGLRPWSWMIDSRPFRSMSIGLPIHEIRLYQILTLKPHGKVRGVVTGKYHIGGPVSTGFASFTINQTNNSWHGAISKVDLEKFKVMAEVKGQSHKVDPAIQPMHFPFLFHANRTNRS